MQISILKNVEIKEKTIYSESEELIIGTLAYFVHFKIAIICLQQKINHVKL